MLETGCIGHFATLPCAGNKIKWFQKFTGGRGNAESLSQQRTQFSFSDCGLLLLSWGVRAQSRRRSEMTSSQEPRIHRKRSRKTAPDLHIHPRHHWLKNGKGVIDGREQRWVSKLFSSKNPLAGSYTPTNSPKASETRQIHHAHHPVSVFSSIGIKRLCTICWNQWLKEARSHNWKSTGKESFAKGFKPRRCFWSTAFGAKENHICWVVGHKACSGFIPSFARKALNGWLLTQTRSKVITSNTIQATSKCVVFQISNCKNDERYSYTVYMSPRRDWWNTDSEIQWNRELFHILHGRFSFFVLCGVSEDIRSFTFAEIWQKSSLALWKLTSLHSCSLLSEFSFSLRPAWAAMTPSNGAFVAKLKEALQPRNQISILPDLCFFWGTYVASCHRQSYCLVHVWVDQTVLWSAEAVGHLPLRVSPLFPWIWWFPHRTWETQRKILLKTFVMKKNQRNGIFCLKRKPKRKINQRKVHPDFASPSRGVESWQPYPLIANSFVVPKKLKLHFLVRFFPKSTGPYTNGRFWRKQTVTYTQRKQTGVPFNLSGTSQIPECSCRDKSGNTLSNIPGCSIVPKFFTPHQDGKIASSWIPKCPF